ncbi:hypothetical protein E1B28_013857 [Marasmius oreades]|uniref:Uncharacterized protein n=1 Tax=Marasmius oreades TaxID=181124 RepID=A0A9P7RK82_9AGAR|nr:uncharacterized protein E1B28_013857 [Marasmius oreades]KAG7085317.1 hypothetical protein E1B28_013857 [Marasmius oreades]
MVKGKNIADLICPYLTELKFNSHPSNDKTPTTPVVGGTLGAVALIFLILAIHFYRHRRPNQYDQENKLPHQQPPVPTFLSSTITAGQHVTSPPIPVLMPQSPISTMNQQLETPVGIEETTLVQQGPYQPSSYSHSMRSSPPLYSVAPSDQSVPSSPPSYSVANQPEPSQVMSPTKYSPDIAAGMMSG